MGCLSSKMLTWWLIFKSIYICFVFAPLHLTGTIYKKNNVFVGYTLFWYYLTKIAPVIQKYLSAY